LPPLTVEQNKLLATTLVEELLKLPMLQPDQVTDPLWCIPDLKTCKFVASNGRSRPMGQAWCRLSTHDRIMRGWTGAGTPDEVGAVGALLMEPDGTFITGSDFLMDGGVTASYLYGELASK